jgi:hypothetical protein
MQPASKSVKLSFLSVVPSALGLAIIMSGEPAQIDYTRAVVCFVLAIAMRWAGERTRH